MTDEEKRYGTKHLIIPKAPEDASADWTMFRVRTEGGSTYDLAIFRRDGARPLAALSNARHVDGQEDIRDAQDSAPLTGSDPLLTTANFESWVGKTLTVGAITTTKVESVEPERSPAVVTKFVTTMTGTKPIMRSHKSSPPLPYPEDCVDAAEQMVRHMKKLLASEKLFADVRANPALESRLRTAIDEAGGFMRVLKSRSNA
jgi:hypothetical protein